MGAGRAMRGWWRALAAVALGLISSVCAAQMAPPHGGGQPQGGVPGSDRNNFAAQCGIADASVERAMRFIRSGEGTWSVLTADARPAPTDSGMARMWHERHWMVDMHDSPGQGMGMIRMHTAQMCFSPTGRIVRMLDRYMDMQGCGCMRYTAMSFDETSGRVVRRELRYVDVRTGREIATPDGAGDFPTPFQFRKVEQLPFWRLLKQ